MRSKMILATLVCVAAAAAGLGTDLAPATKMEAGLTIKGQVKTAAAWDLQKPDLSRVVVYLASSPALDSVGLPHPHATVGQKNKAFVPNFLVVPRGTDVEFPNWDNFDHNVFSISKAAPAFDLSRYPKGESKTRNFDKVGVVQTFCNIHAEMRAIIVVTPNVFFTRAAADGSFQLSDVPTGHYEVVAWQERCGEQRQAVEVREGPMPEVSFTLSENRENILANDAPKPAGNYGVERGLGVKREVLNLPVVKEAHRALDPEK